MAFPDVSWCRSYTSLECCHFPDLQTNRLTFDCCFYFKSVVMWVCSISTPMIAVIIHLNVVQVVFHWSWFNSLFPYICLSYSSWMSPVWIETYLSWISHEIRIFSTIFNWGFSQPEERSCSVGWLYSNQATVSLFYLLHITVIRLAQPQIDTSPHRRGSLRMFKGQGRKILRTAPAACSGAPRRRERAPQRALHHVLVTIRALSLRYFQTRGPVGAIA